MTILRSLTLLLVLAIVPLGLAAGVELAPSAEGPVAAVFPVWWGQARAFAAAGGAGAVLRFGGARFVVVVVGDRGRLRAAGAWMLLDPRVLGCSAI